MLKIAVLCVSDRAAAGTREDYSGPAIQDALRDIADCVRYAVVPDDREKIEEMLISLCALPIHAVLTTGGTGFAPRDVTPEATLAVADKLAPGIAEALRAQSLKITPHAMLSRGVSVIRQQVLIVNLPGSPKAAAECAEMLRPVLPHAAELLAGTVTDCARGG